MRTERIGSRGAGVGRKRWPALLLLLPLAAAAAAWARPAPSPPAPQAATQQAKRALVVSHTAGFRHGSIPTGTQVLTELGQRTGQWSVDLAPDAAAVREKLTGEYLRQVDLVIFLNTTGELPLNDEAKAAFQQWITAGGGFVGMHSATDTFYEWDFFGRMIGGWFQHHPWHEQVTVRVEDPKFPGFENAGSSFQITDEIYVFRNWSRADKHVILSIDNSSVNAARGRREDNDYALAWAKPEGEGRVFYTALGHRDEVWRDPRFQEQIIGGIRWALRLVDAELTLGRRGPGQAPEHAPEARP